MRFARAECAVETQPPILCDVRLMSTPWPHISNKFVYRLSQPNCYSILYDFFQFYVSDMYTVTRSDDNSRCLDQIRHTIVLVFTASARQPRPVEQ